MCFLQRTDNLRRQVTDSVAAASGLPTGLCFYLYKTIVTDPFFIYKPQQKIRVISGDIHPLILRCLPFEPTEHVQVRRQKFCLHRMERVEGLPFSRCSLQPEALTKEQTAGLAPVISAGSDPAFAAVQAERGTPNPRDWSIPRWKPAFPSRPQGRGFLSVQIALCWGMGELQS